MPIDSAFDSTLVGFIQCRYRAVCQPEKAKAMAAYMKTTMPFYGIAKPERLPIYRQMKKEFKPADRYQYESAVGALWRLPHREEKYAALYFASAHEQFINPDSMPLYERLIREGAWWDLVDEIATHLAGKVLLKERRASLATYARWLRDGDLWIRRAAILGQIGHKKETDQSMLSEFCLALAHEKDFFIRKAIGWALRDYSWSNPAFVTAFLKEHGHLLSPLSRREASKRLPQRF